MDVSTNVTTNETLWSIFQSIVDKLSLWWVLLILIIIAGIFLYKKFNKLKILEKAVEKAFSDIDIQMQRRFDLVENLVNTVKGYAIHEKETLTNVIKARSSFLNAKSTWEKISANDQLSWNLRTLYAVAEQYPELKANQNFLQLQNELTDIENRIASNRHVYNSYVQEYNTAREIFPNNIVANLFHFKKQKSFSIYDEAAKKAPKVQF